MKKFHLFFVVAATFFLCSCFTPRKFGYSTRYFDYSEYVNTGFFITESTTVPFEYSPVGSMSVTEYSGEDKTNVVVKSPSKSSEDLDGIYGMTPKRPKNYREATAKSAVAAMVERARKVGANGLVGISIHTDVDENSQTVLSVTVSGMLINR